MKSLRPYQTEAVIAAVASQTAADLMRIVDVVRDGETREQTQDRIARQILDTRHELRHGGAYAASVLSDRIGFDFEGEIAELLDGFDAKVAKLVSSHVRDWVMETKPRAPFIADAYVTLSDEEARLRGYPPGTEGIAFRTEGLDRSAYARFVPKEMFEAYVKFEGGGRSGIIAWEGIKTSRSLNAGVETAVIQTARKREDARIARAAAAPKPATDLPGPVSPEDFRKPILEAMAKATEALNGTDEAAAHRALEKLATEMTALHSMCRDSRLRLTDEEVSAPAPGR